MNKAFKFILCGLLIFMVAIFTIAGQGKTTLRFWIHQHPPEIKFIQDVLIPEFKKTHPNVDIEFAFFPNKDYTPKIMVAQATGTGPDFFDLSDGFVPLFLEKGLIDPVDPTAFGFSDQAKLVATYMKDSLNGLEFNGKIYAIPIQLNSFTLLINTKYFKEAGLDPKKDYPKTWDDVVNVAKKLVKVDSSGRMIREGFDFPYNGPVWAMYNFDPLIKQFGGSILTSDGKKAALNSAAGIAAMTMWQNLSLKYKVSDPNITVATPAVPNEDYTQGKVAMWATGPWALEQVKANPDVYNNTMVVPYPQKDLKKPYTLLTGWVWAVNKISDTKKKKLAWEFIAMAASRPTDWLLKLGFPQPKLDWYKTKEAQTFPYLDTWIKDMNYGTYMVRSVYYDEISQSVDRAIQRCMFDKMDPKKSLDMAADEINKILSGK